MCSHLHKSGSWVVALWNRGVHHCFKLHVDGGERRLSKLGFKSIPDILGGTIALVPLAQVSIHFQEDVPKGTVIGTIPFIDLGLLNTILTFLRARLPKDPYKSRGTQEVHHLGGPCEVVGAIYVGDSRRSESW
ncbi:hypothetical protein PAXRUDRAFT_773887, partial [Paxillus rubicundulus Ve08.2h10]